MGFINFYRRYIRDLPEFTSVPSVLTKKHVQWTWGPEQQTASEKIKENFLQYIVIEYPDFSHDFYLSTDASRTHIGAELFQVNHQGQHRTLGFASRTLNQADYNYFTTELELLAIVFGYTRFRNYILGYTTHVFTDHYALTFLNTCQLLNSRLTRWAIKLRNQEFDLKIQHISGKENVGANTLSRYLQSPAESNQKQYQEININQLVTEEYSPALMQQFNQLKTLQGEDPKIQRIMNRFLSKPNKFFNIYQGILFLVEKTGRYRVMIPASMT